MEGSWPRLKKGDLVVFVGGTRIGGAATVRYEHWAVYIGDGEIVHYQPCPESGKKDKSLVIRESLQKYVRRLDEAPTVKVGGLEYGNMIDFQPLDSEMVIERAKSEIGGSGYNLIINNCEHFAKWCKYGERMSDQIYYVSVIIAMLSGCFLGFVTGVVNGEIINGSLGAILGSIFGGLIGAYAGYLHGDFLSMYVRRNWLLQVGTALLLTSGVGVELQMHMPKQTNGTAEGFLLGIIGAGMFVMLCIGKDKSKLMWKIVFNVFLISISVQIVLVGPLNAVKGLFYGMCGWWIGVSGFLFMTFAYSSRIKLVRVTVVVLKLPITSTTLNLCLFAFAGGVCRYGLLHFAVWLTKRWPKYGLWCQKLTDLMIVMCVVGIFFY